MICVPMRVCTTLYLLYVVTNATNNIQSYYIGSLLNTKYLIGIF